MAIEISARLVGDDKVLAMFAAAGPTVKKGMLDEMNRATIRIQNKVVHKLSGPVLNTRTGLLRDSINAQVEDDGSAITGTVGTNVVYAGIHEYGGTIHHPGGTAYFVDSSGAHFIANSNPLADEMMRTKPHDIPEPERSYLRSTLIEETAATIEGFKAALGIAVTEAKAA
jgi:phage gpG-like protein